MQPRLKWSRHSDLGIQRKPSMDRDEYLDWMTFKGGSRIPFTEIFGPIIGLKEEWEAQGATESELDFSAFTYRAPKLVGIAAHCGRLGRSQEVIEETETIIRYQDDLGRKLRLEKGFASLPLPENYPVRTMDDWIKVKPKYQFSEERFGADWVQKARQAREDGHALTIAIPGGFDEPRQLMGEEMVCMACFEQPDLIHDILQTIGDTALEVMRRVAGQVQIDILTVHEDMAGKSGSLFGPQQIKEFIQPYYRKVWDYVHEKGARLFDQDSDGDMNAVIPAFLDAGVNCMHPMEPASNMDIVKTREEYGESLAFYGGIDKHIIRRSREEIVAELEYKIPPMVHSRGCMIALDHRIPNGTPLDNYRFYLKKAWEIIQREEASLDSI